MSGARAALLGAIAAALAGAAAGAPGPGDPRAEAPGRWEPLKIGGGGWITEIDLCRSGRTAVIRTDTYGAYVKDARPGVADAWRQVVRADTMPPQLMARFGDWTNAGAYAIRVAPSDCDRLYMAYQRKVYRSVDRGATWTETAFSYAGAMDANDRYRTRGERMAVDPADPDVVYLGTVSDGLYVTFDAGASWRLAPGVPAPAGAQAGAGVTGIAFDASSGTTGGRTRTLFAASSGNGVYRSTDAGASWAPLAAGPANVSHAAVARDGVYYAVDRTSRVHRFARGRWSDGADTRQSLHTIAADPFDAARIVAGGDGGRLSISTDGGKTFREPIWDQYTRRRATDVPWLAFANERYMSSGSQVFDPRVPNRLWFAEGIGVWTATLPATSKGPLTWTSESAGIEQLVGRDVCVPPGSANVIVAGMDRSLFVVPRANASYPSRYGTEPSPSRSIIHAWDVSWAADDPAHLVAIVQDRHGQTDLSAYSLDGGATWTRFPTSPVKGMSGCAVAPSIDDVIAVFGNGYAWRTTDRGASWTQLSLPGASPAEARNLHGGYNHRKHVLAVDGVDRNTVYLHFHGHGIYRSTDGGATWALVSARSFDGGNAFWHTVLRAVPGKAGHLFLTTGQAGGAGSANPHNTHLWRSTDGGATWTTVAGMAEPYDVALGKAAPGATYPAIYVVGWLDGAYGIWRSTDDAATWTNLGPFPFGSFDQINRIAASQDVYGEVYVAFQGSGYAKLAPGGP